MATKHVICNLNLNGNQIENVVAQSLTEAPSNPIAGQFYYDSTNEAFGYYNGTTWIYCGAGNIYEVDTIGNDETDDIYKVYYGSTETSQVTGTKTTFKFRALKSVSNYITLGKATSGGKEYITIDLADLSISKITGLQTALDNKLDDSQLSTSTSLIDQGDTVASNNKIPSQKAVKTYIDNEINKINTDISGGMHFIGTWDGTKTIQQNLTTTGQAITKLRKGDFWIVSVSGSASGIPSTSGGSDDNVLHQGDMVVGITDVSTITNVVASNFKVIDNTESADIVRIDSAQTLTNKVMSGSSNTFSNIPESAVTNLTTDLSNKVAKTSITTSDALNTNTSTYKTTVPSDYTVAKAIQSAKSAGVQQYKQVVTTGTSVTITAATHGCGKYPQIRVYQTTSNTLNEVITQISMNSSGDVTVSWNKAATTSSAISIVILGSTSLS